MADTKPQEQAGPWPYHSVRPQRYASQSRRYLAAGGTVRLHEDVAGFVAGNTNIGDMARFYTFCLVQDQLAKEDIAGEIAEIGVYRGHTATLLAKTARRLGKTLYLFDTFEGFDERDVTGIDAGKRLLFSDTSLGAVRTLVGEDSVRYVQGYFPQTASAVPDDAAFALVHIDCDLYAPITSALEFFYPRMSPGGFMLIHDYSSLGWDGAERAVDEFLADKPEGLIPMPDSAGTAAFRKAKPPGTGDWYARKRATLLRQGWIEAAGNHLASLLDDGWSTPETWGKWGIDERHEMSLYFAEPPATDLNLEIECQVVLIGARQEMQVDVFLEQAHVACWDFTKQRNNAVRSLLIPADLVAARLPRLRISFAPRSVVAPMDLDPTKTDWRKLGLGVRRMRLAVPDRLAANASAVAVQPGSGS
jgi:hypothetical protein